MKNQETSNRTAIKIQEVSKVTNTLALESMSSAVSCNGGKCRRLSSFTGRYRNQV